MINHLSNISISGVQENTSVGTALQTVNQLLRSAVIPVFPAQTDERSTGRPAGVSQERLRRLCTDLLVELSHAL